MNIRDHVDRMHAGGWETRHRIGLRTKDEPSVAAEWATPTPTWDLACRAAAATRRATVAAAAPALSEALKGVLWGKGASS